MIPAVAGGWVRGWLTCTKWLPCRDGGSCEPSTARTLLEHPLGLVGGGRCCVLVPSLSRGVLTRRKSPGQLAEHRDLLVGDCRTAFCWVRWAFRHLYGR